MPDLVTTSVTDAFAADEAAGAVGAEAIEVAGAVESVWPQPEQKVRAIIAVRLVAVVVRRQRFSLWRKIICTFTVQHPRTRAGAMVSAGY
jgi:hypothetical protein